MSSLYFFFFFSSRRRHTRWPRDWSSDVCSSDLYPLRRAVTGASAGPDVTIAVMGAVVPEALAAAERLVEAGTQADVVCVSSPGLLFRALRARQGAHGQGSFGQGLGGEPWILEQAFPAARA